MPSLVFKWPATSYQDEYSFSLGRETVEIKTAAFHSEDADAIIYVPTQKFLIAVDTLVPGEVPFMDFGFTADIGEYIKVFDEILAYDFDTILTGHVSVLGNREDVINSKEYVLDVSNTALKGMATLQEQCSTCSAEIIDRWQDRLSVVDVWADSHCEKMFMYHLIH